MPWIRRKQRESGDYFYVVLPRQGSKRGERWVYAGKTEQDAGIKLKEIELALAKEEELPRKPQESPRFSVLVAGFLTYAEANLVPDTVGGYKRALERFQAFLKDDPPGERVSPAILEAYKASRRDVSFNTLRIEYMTLRSLYTWAKRLGYCQSAPTDKVGLRAPEHHKPPKFLTRPEVERLLEITRRNPVHHAAVATLAYAGLRAGELCRLTWGDVDLEHHVLRVKGKGGKFRAIPIGARLQTILEALPTRTS